MSLNWKQLIPSLSASKPAGQGGPTHAITEDLACLFPSPGLGRLRSPVPDTRSRRLAGTASQKRPAAGGGACAGTKAARARPDQAAALATADVPLRAAWRRLVAAGKSAGWLLPHRLRSRSQDAAV